MKNQNIPSLWGEELPYSQVYITKEIRILEYQISRTFFYVTADINPATIEILNKHKSKIKNKEILTCLSEAEPLEGGNGYKWLALGSEDVTYEEAEEFASKLTDAIIEMHKLVMEFLD